MDLCLESFKIVGGKKFVITRPQARRRAAVTPPRAVVAGGRWVGLSLPHSYKFKKGKYNIIIS